MRLWWELLRRFPMLPPFGPAWFGVLSDQENPLAFLRLDWIATMLGMDRTEEDERRLNEMDYLASFWNLEGVRKAREIRLGEQAPVASGEVPEAPLTTPIRIIEDTSEWKRRLEAAEAGTLELSVDPDLIEQMQQSKEARRAQQERERGTLVDEGPVDPSEWPSDEPPPDSES